MKDITTLKAALKILKKGHKKCKEFQIGCYNCQHTLMTDLLDDTIKDYEWSQKYKLKI